MSRLSSENKRVYEVAKALNLDSRRLIDLLRRLKVEVRNHMSTLEPAVIHRVTEIVQGSHRDPEAEAAPPKEAPKAAPRPPIRPPMAPRAAAAVSHEGSPGAWSAPGKVVPPLRTGPRPAFAPGGSVPPGGAGSPAGGARTSHVFSPPGSTPRPAEATAGAASQRSKPGFAPAATPSTSGKPQAPKHKGRPDHWGGDRRREGSDRVLGNRRGSRHAPKERVRSDKPVVVEGGITVQDLARKAGLTAAEVIKGLMNLGVMATLNQEIDADTVEIVAAELGFKVELKAAPLTLEDEVAVETPDDPESLKPRPPVVTVMGHVDHGKTSLLDAYRETRVTDSEAGGITQHIGAYVVHLQNRKIIFLDTPGHEAFTSMRARGAKVTDLAVLVVAADDGVMPQTIEAINHARAAEVPILVAINKIDKPGANPDRVKQQLAEHNVVSEEWGGDTIMVAVSARQRLNLDKLLEMILLVAELRELKANPDRNARGTVIEGRLDKGRGPVAAVLIQNGTLKVGDVIVVGGTSGKVRALFDDKGKAIRKAGPSLPVEVLGLEGVPDAGDTLIGVDDERKARELAEERSRRRRLQELRPAAGQSLDDLLRAGETDVKDYNLVLKADVHGSVEALQAALERLSTADVRVRILHQGVGAINESDVMLAAASKAAIIGFNVRPDVGARAAAERERVEIRTHRVIYEVLDEVRASMAGLLNPTLQETVIGRAEVRALFKVPKVGVVAGIKVVDGKITRTARVRLLRDNAVIFEGKIDSLRHFKDDVKEILTGFEGGLGLEKFNDLKENDVIEAYLIEEVPTAL